jgi:tight adherence protein B
MAIVLQGRTGGNLAAVLDALARVIRERFAMQRKIRAVSAEGRITAYIVSAAPFIIYGALNLISPTFYGDVKDDPAYPYLLGTGIVLAVLNALWLRKLVRFHF